ncbi:MAG: hypothetical protein QM784_36100 [Polyangiaceae bacterium]
MARNLRIFFAIPTALGLAFACHTEPAPGVPRTENKAEARSRGATEAGGAHRERSVTGDEPGKPAKKGEPEKASSNQPSQIR